MLSSGSITSPHGSFSLRRDAGTCEDDPTFTDEQAPTASQPYSSCADIAAKTDAAITRTCNDFDAQGYSQVIRKFCPVTCGTCSASHYLESSTSFLKK